MEYNLEFGKKKRKQTPRVKNPKKPTKKMLDTLTLKKLKSIATKYKISCYKKGTKKCVKKSTLLNRIKKSKSINKILKSVYKMKTSKSSTKLRMMSSKSTRFGIKHLQPNTPILRTQSELSLGQTNEYQRNRYNKTPLSFLTYNFQGTGMGSTKNRMQLSSKNYPTMVDSFGRSSLQPYRNSFGQYFH
jgi:hypothetical protein